MSIKQQHRVVKFWQTSSRSTGLITAIHRQVISTNNYKRHFLVKKPTDALNSNCIGITTLHVSGSLSAHHQEFLAIHWHWYILCRSDDRLLPGAGCPWQIWWPFATRSKMLLIARGHQICIKCTNADTNKIGIQCICWFYSQGIVTMHGHTILKYKRHILRHTNITNSFR